MEFYSGKSGHTGRFSEGVCLRRVQQLLTVIACRPEAVAKVVAEAKAHKVPLFVQSHQPDCTYIESNINPTASIDQKHGMR